MTSRIIVDQLEGKPGSGNIVTVPTGHTLYAPGCVIQVVHETINDEKNNTTHGITNGTWQFTGVTATITPKVATSKILIQYNQSYFWQTAGSDGGAQGHYPGYYPPGGQGPDYRCHRTGGMGRRASLHDPRTQPGLDAGQPGGSGAGECPPLPGGPGPRR